MDAKDKVIEKRDAGGGIERTRSLRHYAPPVDIYEAGDALTLLADMPGVGREQASVSLENGVLTLEGHGKPRVIDEDFRPISREFEPCGYHRMFTLSDEIDNDKIEAVLFSDIIEKFIPPKKERTHALRILRELLYIEPHHRGTNLKLACDFINNTHPRRSIIFVFSDFYDSGYEKPFKMLAKQHDVIPIMFRDPMEDTITDQRGLFVMHDLESDTRHYIDLSDRRTREEYVKNLKTLRAERNRLFTSIGLDYIEVSTDRPYIKPLFEFFNRRARKL